MFNSTDTTISSLPSNPYKRITRRIDHNRIRSQRKKDIHVTISRTPDINYVFTGPLRAGVVLYTKYNEETYFCLGVDTESGDLTDFGGGAKKGETIVEAAERELSEESLGVFQTVGDINNTITFHTHNMYIIFTYIDVDMQQAVNSFYAVLPTRDDPEVNGMVWLTTEEILESIHGRGRKMYVRVRRLLSKVTSEIRRL